MWTYEERQRLTTGEQTNPESPSYTSQAALLESCSDPAETQYFPPCVYPWHNGSAQGRRPVSTPILLVEDDSLLRMVLQLLLEDAGHDVIAASDIVEAVQRAEATKPSLVILDAGLSLVDSYGIATKIRAHYGERLPILVLTACSETSKRERDLWVTAYLRKPFNEDRLITLVGRCLNEATSGAACC